MEMSVISQPGWILRSITAECVRYLLNDEVQTFGIDVYQDLETFVNATSGFKCVFVEGSLYFQPTRVNTETQKPANSNDLNSLS